MLYTRSKSIVQSYLCHAKHSGDEILPHKALRDVQVKPNCLVVTVFSRNTTVHLASATVLTNYASCVWLYSELSSPETRFSPTNSTGFCAACAINGAINWIAQMRITHEF